MTSRGGSFRNMFFAALLGGLLVAVLGFGAVQAGWIGKNETTTRTIATANPVADNQDQGLVNQIYERDGTGVGFITASGVSEGGSEFDPYGQSQQGTATGSGFLIDKEGHMVTNNHVVNGASEIKVTLGDSDTSYDAELVGADESSDLALLKVDAPEDAMHPLAIGDSADMKVGDPVVAIGNPFGLDRTVTTGIVSALQREIQSTNGFSISNVIQTDASINPGNSGGPLINTDGEVIGVNSQIATGGGSNGSVGIGFAIPSDTVKSVVDQLKTTGEVKHAFLGISGATINSDVADALNLDTDSGVLVQEVTKDSGADDAGIEGGDTAVTVEGAKVLTGGDIITAVDGKDVSSMEEVVAAINEAKVGDKIDVTLDRDGQSKDVTVTLGERPDDASGSSSGDSSQTPPEQQGEQPALPPGFGQ
ncbi:MAG TPA: trypsin-like peptidase domain-containing protein [Solirubrobacterales bacterium]|nr:trypsin-like peptidase domain-containing protein [Solirubrobacterales bacterium]